MNGLTNVIQLFLMQDSADVDGQCHKTKHGKNSLLWLCIIELFMNKIMDIEITTLHFLFQNQNQKDNMAKTAQFLMNQGATVNVKFY